jgi:hypothetical protein
MKGAYPNEVKHARPLHLLLLLHSQRDAFAAAAGGPRLRGRPEADPEGMAACGQSLEGFAQMQCWLALMVPACL